jgi:pyridoxamine 5'-phosphate oxidase
MIKILNKIIDNPYQIFYLYYEQALKKNQAAIDAICISSFSKETNEVSSRFINLKYIKDDQFIFFSNYKSSKSVDFENHNQISAVIFWDSINIQIRMKAKIKKTSKEYNQNYFVDRSEKKNALAISSNQSNPIDSYNQVVENYNKSLKNDNLKKCPNFWGGFSFTPYYFEFWEGHESRLNKREVYEKRDDSWKHLILQP